MKLPRLFPTPSMVVACLALVLTPRRTGYAAIALPKAGVETSHLHRYAVTHGTLATNAVTVAGRVRAGVAVVEALGWITAIPFILWGLAKKC